MTSPSLLVEARQAHTAQYMLDAAQAQSFLDELQQHYDEGHSSQIKQLKSSRHIQKYIRLMASPYVFQQDTLLKERVLLCLNLLQDSPQRPVHETLGLVLLKLYWSSHWSIKYPELIQEFITLLPSLPHPDLTKLALCIHQDLPEASKLTTKIQNTSVTSKKTRIGELVEIVEIYPEHLNLEQFIQDAYVAIFGNTNATDKLELLKRIIRECLDKELFLKDSRWKLLVEPVITQNLSSHIAREMLEELIVKLPEEHLKDYLFNHVVLTATQRRMFTPGVLEKIKTEGTRHYIPYLVPSTQLTQSGLRGPRLTTYAIKVKEVIEHIAAREGINNASGSLSLVDNPRDGGLTVFEETQGTLTLEAVTTPIQRVDPTQLQPPVLDQAILNSHSDDVLTQAPMTKSQRLNNLQLAVLITLFILGLLVLRFAF